MSAVHALEDLQGAVSAGRACSRAEAERILATPDLVSVGVLGETGRQRATGARVTFGRVVDAPAGVCPAVGAAGDVRVTGVPASLDEAVTWVRRAAAVAGPVPLTGFSLADLFEACGRQTAEVTRWAQALGAAGLGAVAAVPVDRFASTDELVAVVHAVTAAGLGAPRATIERADLGARLDLIERAAALQARTRALRAFAPLPRIDPADVPATGYDDVRTVAVARVVCADIPLIQVDWPLYGPKLAQVAITFGANDIDGLSADDDATLGPRRTTVEDISRQIRSASAEPVERNGRYEVRG